MAFSIKVSNYIRDKLIDFQKETGNLYNYETTPAESTAYRLAKRDREEFDDIITRGTPEAPYYTNSCHIPVAKVDGIKNTFDHQDDLQTLFTGGTVIHNYLNGSISGEQAKYIVRNKRQIWLFSGTMSLSTDCLCYYSIHSRVEQEGV